MTRPNLYTLEQDLKDNDCLSVCVTYPQNGPAIEPKAIVDARNSYGRKPLSKTWTAPPMIIERRRHCPDIIQIEPGLFAVSEKAKRSLSQLMGLQAEFLPLKIVGERRKDGEAPKPMAAPPTLYLLNPLVEVPLGKGSVSWKMAYRHITKYVFHPDDVNDLPMFRAEEDIIIVVNDSFRTHILQEAVRGLRFDSRLEWYASPHRSTSSAPEPSRKKQRKQIESPKWLSETEIAAAMEMTPSRWNCLLQQWSWVCETAKQRNWHLDQRLKISKPIAMKKLTSLRQQVGEPMPTEFEHVLTNYASKVSFAWSVSDSPSCDPLPKKLQPCCGCFDDLWNVENLPRLANEARRNRESSLSYFHKTYLGRLPFIAVGNGDHIAFDMRLGTKNCPVVYLSHDDPEINDRMLARNFVEFLLSWSSVGCVGPDFSYFAPFYDRKRKRIAPYCRNAQDWRQLLSSND